MQRDEAAASMRRAARRIRTWRDSIVKLAPEHARAFECAMTREAIRLEADALLVLTGSGPELVAMALGLRPLPGQNHAMRQGVRGAWSGRKSGEENGISDAARVSEGDGDGTR